MSIQIISHEHLQRICELFDEVEKDVRIISPFIGIDMANILCDRMSENTNLCVKIITRFYREDFIQRASKIDALEKLHNTGAEIYALIGLHTKLYLFDMNTALLGSANFTSGGFRLNHELSLCIEDENEVNPLLVAFFDDLLKEINKSGDYRLTADIIAEEKKLVTSLLEQRTDSKTKYSNPKKFGAKIPFSSETPSTEQPDTIQAILLNYEQTEYNETIWLKLEGDAKGRFNLSEKYAPHTSSQLPQGFVRYPANKKPSVSMGDYIYLAAVCEDERGNAVLPYIVGRGRSNGYQEGNVATQEMIAENPGMARYPHYCTYMEFEYLDSTISECIPLINILQDLGSDTYVSTVGKSVSIGDLRKRHHQKAHLRLTAKAKTHIDNLFDELVRKHGSKKL